MTGVPVPPFQRTFDENSPFWNRSREMNLIFLRMMQHQANARLRAFGFVFLNEVFELLGLTRTSEGQLYGWWWNSENGDSYIDFGIDENLSPDHDIPLDFNVDGIIYNLIEGS